MLKQNQPADDAHMEVNDGLSMLQPEKETPEAKSALPGSKCMPFLFIGIGMFFAIQSLPLLQKQPKMNGYGFFPMLLSCTMVLLGILDAVKDRKIASANTGGRFLNRLRGACCYLFPLDVTIGMLIILGYCGALVLGLGFVATSILYLFISMCYFIPHDLGRNVLYTAICMIVIYALFVVVFKVRLP